MELFETLFVGTDFNFRTLFWGVLISHHLCWLRLENFDRRRNFRLSRARYSTAAYLVSRSHRYRRRRLQTQQQRRSQNWKSKMRLKWAKAQVTRSNYTNLNSCSNKLLVWITINVQYNTNGITFEKFLQKALIWTCLLHPIGLLKFVHVVYIIGRCFLNIVDV